jgi:L-lactate dehydrogenase (cytochrome)
MSYAFSFNWTLNYLFRKKFDLPFLSDYVGEGTSYAVSVSDYFSTMLDQKMNWSDAEKIKKDWDGPFCLKGIMSVEDAKNAVKIGASSIMLSNHGGRQLDGSRSPFDQLKEILDSVGGEIEVICDGGIRRGTHILKALSLGASACSGGRLYLYALAAGGYKGVKHSLNNLQNELIRDMKLMGCKNINELTRNNIRFKNV